MQDTSLIILFILTTIVHLVNTSAYAARLAGVRTGRLTLASSLFSVLALTSRGANALAGPLLASLTDLAVNTQDNTSLLNTYQVVMLSATVGTFIAGLLMPSLSRVLAEGVTSYEQRRSLPRVVIRGFSVHGLWKASQVLKSPKVGTLREARRSPFPKRFLILSILTTAIYTVTNFAGMYASALVPEGARTATSLTPLLTSGGVLVKSFFVDPFAALVVDEALRGERALKDVTYITTWEIGARLVGTLLAQVLLLPGAQIIAFVTRLLVGSM